VAHITTVWLAQDGLMVYAGCQNNPFGTNHLGPQSTGAKQEGRVAMSIISKSAKSVKSAWSKAYTDTEGTLGVILIGLTLHMVFSVCTGAVLAVISAPWYLTLLIIWCECIIAYLTIKPLMDQAKERFYHGSSQN